MTLMKATAAVATVVVLVILLGAAMWLMPWLFAARATRLAIDPGIVFVGDSLPLTARVAEFKEWGGRYTNSDLPWPFYRRFTWRVLGPSEAPSTFDRYVERATADGPEATINRLRVPGEARIDERGRLLGTKAGLVTVQVSEGGRAAAREFFVLPAPVKCEMTPVHADLRERDRVSLTVVVEPAPDSLLTWMLGPRIIDLRGADVTKIAFDGFFRPIAPGKWVQELYVARAGKYSVRVRYGSRDLKTTLNVRGGS